MLDVTREQVKMYGVSSNEAGFYFESLVVNRTSNTIVLIDHNNRKVFIEPTDGPRDNTVHISVRAHNGPRREWSKKEHQLQDIPLDSTKITIPSSLIEVSAHIVPELDCMITTPDIAQSILHHKSNKMCLDRVTEIVQNYVANKDGVYIHLLVNDPKDRVNKIYGAFNQSRIFGIEVISMPVTDEKNATILVTAASSHGTYVLEKFDIEPLFENSCFNLNQIIPLSLGLSAEDAMKATTMRLREKEQVIFKQVTDRVADERKEYKETVDKLRADHKEELRRISQDFEVKLREGDAWKAVYAAHHGVQDFQTKRFEADERLQKARLATAAETTKFAHTVVKIASGVIAGVIVPWVYKQIKNKE